MGYTLETEEIQPNDILSVEDACDPAKFYPFRSPFDYESPMKEFMIAWARVLRNRPKPKGHETFLIQTPDFLAVRWRLVWLGRIQVLRVNMVTGRYEVEIGNSPILLTEEEFRQSKILLDRIVVNAPSNFLV